MNKEELETEEEIIFKKFLSFFTVQAQITVFVIVGFIYTQIFGIMNAALHAPILAVLFIVFNRMKVYLTKKG